MRDDIAVLLEKAELALASAKQVAPPEDVERLSQTISATRRRLAYPLDVLVVALAGGTGSGKSSLYNALTGADLADVGGVRPTTNSPAAAIPNALGDRLDAFFDSLAIDRRDRYEGGSLCIIDLPDMDSVSVDNRHRVDSLLPLIDVVAWVTDPEKYRDARLHHDYLTPMARHGTRMIFLVNQIDRVSPDERRALLGDFELALTEDGIDDPLVVAVAADPRGSPPLGLAEVRAALDAKLADRTLVPDRLVGDLRELSQRLADSAGTPLDFDRRATVLLSDVLDLLEDGNLPGGSRSLASFVDAVAAEAGGPTAEAIRKVIPDIPAHVQRIMGEGNAGAPDRQRRFGLSWRRRPAARADVQRSGLEASVTEAVIRPVRVALARRAVAIATIADLVLSLADVDRQSSR